MSYRDDREALRSRVEALEAEIERLEESSENVDELRKKLAAAEAALAKERRVEAAKRVGSRWPFVRAVGILIAVLAGGGAAVWWVLAPVSSEDGPPSAEEGTEDGKQARAVAEPDGMDETHIACRVVTVVNANVVAGDACDLGVYRIGTSRLCLGSLACGEVRLYGSKEGTPFRCPRGWTDLRRIDDTRGSVEDGDPKLRYDASTGEIRVGDDAPAWSVELTTAP